VHRAVINIAEHNTPRAPCLSINGPKNGDIIAARTPPIETAPDIAVLDHSNSSVMGVTKMESVATAGPCRTKPAQHAQNRTTHP